MISLDETLSIWVDCNKDPVVIVWLWPKVHIHPSRYSWKTRDLNSTRTSPVVLLVPSMFPRGQIVATGCCRILWLILVGLQHLSSCECNWHRSYVAMKAERPRVWQCDMPLLLTRWPMSGGYFADDGRIFLHHTVWDWFSSLNLVQ